MLANYRKAHPEQTPEIREDEAYICSQKAAQNEAELEQIRNTSMAILHDIRKNVVQQESTAPKLTRQVWQEMTAQLPKAEDQTIIQLIKEEMVALIEGSVGKTGALDDGGDAEIARSGFADVGGLKKELSSKTSHTINGLRTFKIQ